MDLPRTDDPDTGGFFEAARRHELAVCRCDDCDRIVHPPRDHCPNCHRRSTSWQVVDGTGTLFSYTVQEHQPDPAYEVPFTVVLVELDAAPEVRLAGHLPGRPDLRAGQPMQVRFEHLTPDVVIPQWDPIPPPAGSSEPPATTR